MDNMEAQELCDTTISVLVEVVGAMGLESKGRRRVDPYVRIYMHNNENGTMQKIHQTSRISNDGDPIWTARTKSLCIVQVPTGDDLATATKEESEPNYDSTDQQGLLFDVCHRDAALGSMNVPFERILECCASKEPERLEFCIEALWGTKLSKQAILALRFRKALDEDVTFLTNLYRHKASVKQVNTAETDTEKLQQRSEEDDNACDRRAIVASPNDEDIPLHEPAPGDRLVAGDINFQGVKGKNFFQFYHKKDENGRLLQRVQPYPSPDNPDETEWMTSEDIKRTTYKPSTQWMTAGSGKVGKLHLEILGCNNLPAMDVSIPVVRDSKADAVCMVAFEDNLVRTEAIWSKKSPRWMPWTTRAFQFQVRHPASTICLAVFDFDANPLTNHDPIGRVLLHLTEFHANVTYTLSYPLQHDPRHELLDSSKAPGNDDDDWEETLASSTSPPVNSRGSIIVRIRMEWEDNARRVLYTPQPSFIINVDNKKAYRVLRYLAHGAIDEDNASLQTIKMYANELMSYTQNICYSLDVILETLLWRGSWQITKTHRIWFPLRSLVTFASAVLVMERPDFALPVFFFMIAWVLLTINYHAMNHPYPWKRVNSSLNPNIKNIIQRRALFSSVFRAEDSKKEVVEITPGEGVSEAAILDKLDHWKARRMSALFEALVDFTAKVQKIYSKTSGSSIQMTTKSKRWTLIGSLFEGQLNPIHSALQSACNFIRLTRNFVNWKNNRTSVFTTFCILVAIAWILLPMNFLLRWATRMAVWTLLGPWMILVDFVYFRSWYATKEENLDDIRNGRLDVKNDEPPLPDFDAILESDTFLKVTKAGRIKAEELHKLRDMRALTFGAFSDRLPSSDNSRYPSVPLPESTALCTKWIVPLTKQLRGYHVPGQLITGDMVHGQPGLEAPTDCGKSSKQVEGTGDTPVSIKETSSKDGVEVVEKVAKDKKND